MDDIHELDMVALTEDLPGQGLSRGEVGTVVMEHSPEAVEVEFADQNGRTYALLAVEKTKLMKLRYRKEVA